MLALQDRQPYYATQAQQPRSDYSYNLLPKDRESAAVAAAAVPAPSTVPHEYQQDNYYYSSRGSKSLNSSAPSTNHSSPQHSQVNTSPSLPSIYDPNGPVAAAHYYSGAPSSATSAAPSSAPSASTSAPMSPTRLPMPSPTTSNPYSVGNGQLLNQPFNQPMSQQQLQMQQLQLQQQQIQQIQQLQQQQVQQQQFQAQAQQQQTQYYSQQMAPQMMQQMGYQQQMHPHSHLMNQFSSKRQFRTLKKHVCTVCGKRFTRPSSLQTHTYSHTGEKPFRCEFSGCGRQFSVVSNLRRHQKIHSPRE